MYFPDPQPFRPLRHTDEPRRYTSAQYSVSLKLDDLLFQH